MRFKQKAILFGFLFVFTILSVGCNEGSVNRNAKSDPDDSGQSALPELTIDVSANVPVIAGAASKGIAVIHNNSENILKNIQYQVDTNLPGGGAVLPAGDCATINPYASCTLSIPMPIALTGATRAGAVNLTASYKDGNNQLQQFDSLVNFKLIDGLTAAVYVSPVNLANFGGNLSRGVVYVYVSGNNSYWITDMRLSAPGFKIISGDLTGHHLSPGSVIPVEIEGASPQNLAQINLDIKYKSSDSAISQLSRARLGVFGKVGTEALIATSLVPLVNTESGNSGIAYFQNVGNSPAKIDNVAGSEGITLANQCPDEILSGGYCKVKFNVPANIDQVTNGSITAKAGGAETVADVSWYNGTPAGGAVLSLANVTNDLLILKPGAAFNLTAAVNNPGGFQVDGKLLKPVPYAGNLRSTEPLLVDPDCKLSGHASCTYSLQLQDDTAEASPNMAEINYQGSYTIAGGQDQVVSGRKLFAYQLTDKTPNISIGLPYQPFQLTVQGDGKHVQRAAININNIGDVAARFTKIELQKTADSDSGDVLSFLSVNVDECTGKALPVGKSCRVYLTLGAVNADDLREGKVKLSVAYYGGKEPLAQNISYQILPATFGLSATFNSLTGMEKSGESYVIKGSTTQNKSISWTLSNDGVDQTLQAVEFSDLSPEIWSIDNSAADACFKGEDISQPQKLTGFVLNKGQSCTIKFNNIYGKASPVTNEGPRLTDLYFPRLRVKYGSDFIWLYPPVTDGANSLGPNAAIENQQGFLNIYTKIINNGLPNSYLELNYQLDGGDDYGKTGFTVTLPRNIVKDDGSEALGPCDISPAGGADVGAAKLNVVCNLGGVESTLLESVPLDNQMLMSADYNIPLSFTNDLSGQAIIGVTELATNLLIKKIAHGYIYLAQKNNPVSPTNSYDAVCASDPVASVLKARGYHNFKAVNLDDSSGYTDDLPDGFPLYSVSSDQTAAEKVVTRITKARSPIPGESSKALFKELFTPFENQMSGGSTNSYIYVYGNDKNVAIDGVLGAGGGKFNDCTKDASASTILYYDDHDLINFKNLGTHSLRNLSTTATGAGKLRDSSMACSYANIRVMCTAY